jgi:pSer/pThr/pTyr-binding forkhead associated (FHA) protein
MSDEPLDDFLRACEVDRLPGLRVGSEPSVRALSRPFAVVGSDPRCDLVIDDPTVSLRHCYLQAIGPKLLCVDLGSARGVDAGEGPAVAGWIDRRHSVRVGGQVLGFGFGEAEGAAGRSPGQPTPARGRAAQDKIFLAKQMPKVVLEFQANQVKTRWRMKRPVALVGNAHQCTVKLNGSSVSRYHCALVLTGRGLWVVDLLAEVESPHLGGVSVNGSRVRYSRLDPGDLLQVGRFRVVVRYLPASTSSWSSRREKGNASRAALGNRPLSIRGEPDASSDQMVESLRLELEARLVEQSARHRAEVNRLRREIDDLRVWIEQSRSRDGSARRKSPQRGSGLRDLGATSSPPPSTRVRTLGSAIRRPNPPSPPAPQGRPATDDVDARLSVGIETMTVPVLASVDPSSGASWLNPESRLVTTTHDTRHLP